MAALIFQEPEVLAALTSANAKAYDRWHGHAGAKAQNVMNILETKSSIAMIAKRASQLAAFVKNLRKLRFGDAYDALDIPRGKRKLIKAKTFSDAWLEFTFGWSPLIQDIGTSVEILQREFPADRIRSSAVGMASVVKGGSSSSENALAKVKVVYSGGLKVTNPNLFLANQLGFVNPAAVLWDAVPFSFVVDWFIPVGKFLNSMSNDFGMEVDWPVVSRSVVASGEVRHIEVGMDKPVYFNGRQIIRELKSFQRPDLLDRAHLPQMGGWLAATSVSLLMQQLVAAGKRQ